MKNINILNGESILNAAKEASFATSKVVKLQMPVGWTSAARQIDSHTLEVTTKLDNNNCVVSQFIFDEQIKTTHAVCTDEEDYEFYGELIFEEE